MAGLIDGVPFWRQRNVLVTGCTGFLGSWLTRHLLEAGANVVGLVRDIVPRAPFFAEGTSARIVTVGGSVEDYSLLERTVNEHEVDSVFHLAAQAIVTVANRNPMSTFETNVRGTWNLLEACRRTARVSRIVVASSDKAYGVHSELPYAEDAPLAGTHPYDVSKSCADLIATSYHRTYGTPVCITRCGNLFGPGDVNWSRIVPGTIRSALLGERPIIRSDGSPVRDYLHVEDAVAAYLLVAEKMDDRALHGTAFNFGTGEPLSVLELSTMILRAAGREDLAPLVLNEAKAEIPTQYLSWKRALSVLGWRPRRKVAERLSDTIGWYRRHLEGVPA